MRKTGDHEDNWMHRAKLEATHLSLPSVLKTHMTCRRSHQRSTHILAQDSEKLKEENYWLEIPIGKFLAHPSFDSTLRSSVHIQWKGLSTYNTCHLTHSHTVSSTGLSSIPGAHRGQGNSIVSAARGRPAVWWPPPDSCGAATGRVWWSVVVYLNFAKVVDSVKYISVWGIWWEIGCQRDVSTSFSHSIKESWKEM